MKKAAVFFGEGFEEVEALTQVDLLKRAGIDVVMVSVMNDEFVKGSHGVMIKCDMTFDKNKLKDADAIILPGGMPGTSNLNNCTELKELITEFNNSGKLIAAICAAPSVFGGMGILKGKKACSYPGFEKYLTGAEVEHNSVSHDGNIITSRGVGTAIDFAAEIITYLLDEKTASDVLDSIVYKK